MIDVSVIGAASCKRCRFLNLCAFLTFNTGFLWLRKKTVRSKWICFLASRNLYMRSFGLRRLDVSATSVSGFNVSGFGGLVRSSCRK